MSITYFGNGLGLVSLLGVVCGNTFSFELLSFSILLLIRSKEIDIILAGILFLLPSWGWSGGNLTGEDGTGTAGAGEGGELSLVGLDVLVPAGNVGVAQILGKSLENGNVGLRWGVADKRMRRSSQFRSVRRSMDVNATIEETGQKYWRRLVGMFGAAVSSRLAWKHGPIKIHLSRRRLEKYAKGKNDTDQDLPLDVGPLGEVLLKLREINWHFRQTDEDG